MAPISCQIRITYNRKNYIRALGCIIYMKKDFDAKIKTALNPRTGFVLNTTRRLNNHDPGKN